MRANDGEYEEDGLSPRDVEFIKQQSLPHQIRWNYSFVVVDYGGIAIVCAVSDLAPSNQVQPRACPEDRGKTGALCQPIWASCMCGAYFP